MVGNQVSKEFFQVLRAYHTSARIKRIKEGQVVLIELPHILQAFVCHYEKVFTAQGPSEAQDQALQACLDVTPNGLTPKQYASCEQKLTLADLKEVVFSMADDKASGCDGFPCEFYKSFWDDIVPNLH